MAVTTMAPEAKLPKKPAENDYWDLDEQGLSVFNMQSELGRLKKGDKINLLNVGFDELTTLFIGLSAGSDGLAELMKKLLDNQDKRTREIIDTILKQMNPLASPYNPGQVQPSIPSVGTSPYWGSTSSGSTIKAEVKSKKKWSEDMELE